MRLTQKQIASIRSVTSRLLNQYPDASLWLFGSRINDDVKGGDVDFCLFLSEHDLEKRAKIKRQLRPALEEAINIKTDLVVQDVGAKMKSVAKKAKETGLQLI